MKAGVYILKNYLPPAFSGVGDGGGIDALIKKIEIEKARSLLILVAQKFTYFVQF